jgi:gamma-glutamyltranspeptidase/glutathione hydrolase
MLKRFLTLLMLLVAVPALARGGMVSCADPRAAAAGVEMLRAGGSAADAAAAMMLALNVVEPQSSGIGGGGFLVHEDGRSHALDSYDGRETAPAAAGPRWFYRPDGTPLSHAEAVPGGRSVGVPGNLRLIAMLHAEHGRLPWARLFGPAIRLARDGFAVTPRLEQSLATLAGHVDGSWARRQYWRADGTPKPVGTIIRNPELARLLTMIARRGPDYFYVGPPARALVATVDGAARNPSRMTAGDLASYAAKHRPVPCGSYRGYRICGMGPPSSGETTVFQILKQLERFDLARLGPESPVAWHLIGESMRLAYADRDRYVGDPDYVAVPVAGMMDPAYLARRSALISPDAVIPHALAGTPPGAPARISVPARETAGTTHFVAVDGQGNVATETSTVEGPFGSGLTAQGYFLNNELTDFDIVPDKDGYLAANAVAGGKRPRSSMAPTIVFAPDGSFRLAIGAAGGLTIIAQVAKALIGVIDWHMPAQQAIALPLLVGVGDRLLIEQGSTLEAMAPALSAMGHQVAITPMTLKANAIEHVGGKLVGAADPRSEGVALAE